jgi:hypothetical protein
MNGIRSLNAGAYANLPQQDIRLSGDHRPTYTQRRRTQMAGGGIMGSNAGSMLVAPTADGSRPGYGWLSDIKDKFVDDIIPNELKNPAVLATLGGAALNQWGLPDVLTESMNMGSDVGQDWIGNLLGNVIPGDTQFNTVLGDKVPFTYGMPPTGLVNPFNIGTNIGGITGIQSSTKQDAINYAKQYGLNLLGKELGLTPQQQQQQQQQQRQDVAWKTPMAIGAAAGAYQKKYLEDQPEFGEDKTGINFQTAQEAMADPNLRFKPQAQYANVAEGGRIGYQDAGDVEIPEPDTENILKNLEDFLKKRKDYEDRIMRAPKQSAAEGGLMNLGGMEKDYRQEGGFVPLGGEEKADDVPARLSKNEFVFTADAVRAAGGGDIDAGAEVMENLMENLEAGGEVSEDSQGLEGARGMFANAQQLEKRII